MTPSLSGDGRFVAYASTANNIVAGDNNGAQDAFVVDTTTGAVTRVSVSSTGVEGNADSPVGQGERIAISHDGTWLAFSTQATTLGAPAGNVILHDRVTGETRGASKQQGSSVGVPALSRDGGYVVFGAGTPLDARYRSNSGLFLSYTGLARSFWWFE